MKRRISLNIRIFLLSLLITTFICVTITVSAFLIFNGMLSRNIKESNWALITYLAKDIERNLQNFESFSDYIYLHKGVELFLEKESADENEVFFLKKDIDDDFFRYLNTGSGFSIMSLSILGLNNSQYLYGYDVKFTNNNRFMSNKWIDMFQLLDNEYIWMGLCDREDVLNRKGDYVVTLIRYIRSLSNNRDLGIMILEMSPKDIFKGWDSDYDSNYSVFVQDSNGKIIYPITKGILGQSYKDYEIEQNITSKSHVTRYKLDTFDWEIVVLHSKEVQNRENRKMLYIAFGVFALAMLLYIIVYIIMITKITRPLLMLTQTIHKIRSGDRSARYEYKSEDEVGYLAKSFNIMLDQIDELIEQSIIDERRKQDAEYRALQAQMNPHFLYNTLNSIRWMAMIQDADNIVDSIEVLSRLLRRGMKLKGPLVSLKEELSMLEDYVFLQKIRYKSKFEYTCQIPEELYGYCSLKFLLQPIVENAIFHGIEPKDGKGLITLIGELKDGVIYLKVRDNGIGFKDKNFNPLSDFSDKRDGNRIGLGNIQKRIKRQFGENFGIDFRSETGEYTEITISIPAKPIGLLEDLVE
ncbi:MAG: sensor histidine kinase [Spirochaetaceae bacterium]